MGLMRQRGFRKRQGRSNATLCLDRLVAAIFNTTEVGICVTAPDYRYVRVNRAYCAIYGYSEPELIGHPFTMVVPPEHHEALKKLHDDFLSGTHEIATEWTVLRKDGTPITIYATAARLEGIEGGPYKITTVSDVTDLKTAQEEQKYQERVLIQQSKMAVMGEMIGAIAHQWKQPISAIKSATMDLSMRHELGNLDAAKLLASLNLIDTQTDHMSSTISDFSGFFRPDRAPERINLHESAEKIRVLFGAQLAQRDIALENKIAPTIVIEGLKNQLKQVLINLIANARDAYEENPQKTQIVTLCAEQSGERTCIHVDDCAGGIDETLIDRLGEPYLTTKPKGSGFGLYLCRIILKECFNGHLTIENRYEGDRRIGARFTLVLNP